MKKRHEVTRSGRRFFQGGGGEMRRRRGKGEEVGEDKTLSSVAGGLSRRLLEAFLCVSGSRGRRVF